MVLQYSNFGRTKTLNACSLMAAKCNSNFLLMNPSDWLALAHKHLMYKINYYEINCNAFHWIKDFLKDRTQTVILEGETSNKIPERDDLNPCWRSYTILLYSRCFMILLVTTCSKSLQLIHVSEIGLLSPILTTLFSLSLKTGKIPDDWRYASVFMRSVWMFLSDDLARSWMNDTSCAS
jgi:hypothetical protein